MNSNGADILNFTYFDVFRFPFPTSLTLKKVAVISHWHRDHLPVPSDVADFILLTPPGSNDIGPWFYEGKVTTIMQLPYDPVTMRDGRRFTLLPGYHAYYWLISWKNSAFLYVGDLNYGEVENVAKVVNKLISSGRRLTVILPIYGGIKDLAARRIHRIPDSLPITALAEEVEKFAVKLKSINIRVFGVPHPLQTADWAEEVAVRALRPLTY